MSTYKDLLVESIMGGSKTLLKEEKEVQLIAESVLNNKAFDRYFAANPMLIEGTKELFKRGLITEQTFEQWYNRHGGERYMQGVNLSTFTDYEKRYDPLATETEVGSDAYAQWIIKNRRGLDLLGSRRTREASQWDGDRVTDSYISVGKDDLQNFEKFKNIIKNVATLPKYDAEHRPDLHTGNNANNIYSNQILNYPDAQTLHKTMTVLEDDLFSDGAGKEFKTLKGNIHPRQIELLRAKFGDSFQEPRNNDPAASDYTIVYEDDKWMVVWAFTMKANQFFGQMARKKEVHDIWADQISRRLPYRAAGTPYRGAEWCTVPSNGRFLGYGGGYHDYDSFGTEGGRGRRLFVNIPKINGKPDFMNPYKVQCDGYGDGSANWANVLDNCTGYPAEAFRIKWTRGLWEFYKNTAHFVREGFQYMRTNRTTGQDVRNGQIIKGDVRYWSLIEGDTYPNQPRYRKVQQLKGTNIFIGYETLEDNGGNDPYFLLNPENGDKLDNDLMLRGQIKLTGPDKTVLVAEDGVYICIERADGSHAVVKVNQDSMSVEHMFDYSDKTNIRNGWMFNAIEDGRIVAKRITKTPTRRNTTTRQQDPNATPSADETQVIDAAAPVDDETADMEAGQVEVETLGDNLRIFGDYALYHRDSEGDAYLVDLIDLNNRTVVASNFEAHFVGYNWVRRASDGSYRKFFLDFLLLPNGNVLDNFGVVHPRTTSRQALMDAKASGNIFVQSEDLGTPLFNENLGPDVFELLAKAAEAKKRWFCLTKVEYSLPDAPNEDEFEEKIASTFGTM